MLRRLEIALLLGLTFMATAAGAAETILRDTRHILSYATTGYGGTIGAYWWSDPTAACTVNGASGSYSFVAGSSLQAVCSKWALKLSQQKAPVSNL